MDHPPANESLPVLHRPTTWADLADQLAPISFAWPGWLPNGLLTMLAAESGIGKSAVALQICRSFLSGTAWPDGTPRAEPTGKVLWCEAESAHAVNLQRAARWGIPAERILCPLPNGTEDVRLDLPEHRYAIAAWMHDPEIRFAVIDSLRGSHRGDENSSGSIDTVMWLAALARDCGKPILLTHHLRKRSGRADPQVTLERLRGSSAIPQACRLVWSIDAPDPWCPEVRRLAVIKSNLGPFPPPLGFQIADGGVTFCPPPAAPSAESVEDRACALLLMLLAQAPMSARRVQHEGEKAGISWATMRRAKKRLRVVAVKDGVSGTWYWGFQARQGAG